MGTADIEQQALVDGMLALSDDPDVKPLRLIEFLEQRAGLLVPHGVGVYTFPHRTFQEYLAACHLTDFGRPKEVARLAREAPERWREVTLLAGAKLARGGVSGLWPLIQSLCPAAPESEADEWGSLMAGQILVESAERGTLEALDEATVTRVKWALVRVMQHGRIPLLERALVGRLLAALGDPRDGVGLDADGLPDIEWVYLERGRFPIGGDGKAW